MSLVNVLAVAQTPPPTHGQAVMNGLFLKGPYRRLRILHVRMNFSSSIEKVGRFSFLKVAHLSLLILKTWIYRIFFKINVLYYLPAGPQRIPITRDIIFLICTRWLFPKTVFHFHACGISNFYQKLTPILRFAFRRAYFYPDLSIQLSSSGPKDAQIICSKREIIIPNGLPDRAHYDFEPPRLAYRIVFLSSMIESKGPVSLLRACAALQSMGVSFECLFAGAFADHDFEMRFHQEVQNFGLQNCVRLLGHVSGDEKMELLETGGVFCFPSFYENEGLPLALIEALQYGLPIVASNWRAIPDIVVDGENGFLVPPQNSDLLAEKLKSLLLDDNLRTRMSRAARQRYEDNFRLEMFLERMEDALSSLE